MGCGASNEKNEDVADNGGEKNNDNDNNNNNNNDNNNGNNHDADGAAQDDNGGVAASRAPVSEFECMWQAGTVDAGSAAHHVPSHGPMAVDQKLPAVEAYRSLVVFSKEKIARAKPQNATRVDKAKAHETLYARCFFPHSLMDYCVGWAKFHTLGGRPDFDKERDEEKQVAEQRQQHYLYVESIPALAVVLTINGEPKTTDLAVSTSGVWPVEGDKIAGAFFTFAPPENSIRCENSFQLNVSSPAAASDLSGDGVRKMWQRFRLALIEEYLRLPSNSSGDGDGEEKKHFVEFGLKFRYGNRKFIALLPGGQDRTRRYIDAHPDRPAFATSSVVAKGALCITMTQEARESLEQEKAELGQALSDESGAGN